MKRRRRARSAAKQPDPVPSSDCENFGNTFAGAILSGSERPQLLLPSEGSNSQGQSLPASLPVEKEYTESATLPQPPFRDWLLPPLSLPRRFQDPVISETEPCRKKRCPSPQPPPQLSELSQIQSAKPSCSQLQSGQAECPASAFTRVVRRCARSPGNSVDIARKVDVQRNGLAQAQAAEPLVTHLAFSSPVFSYGEARDAAKTEVDKPFDGAKVLGLLGADSERRDCCMGPPAFNPSYPSGGAFPTAYQFPDRMSLLPWTQSYVPPLRPEHEWSGAVRHADWQALQPSSERRLTAAARDYDSGSGIWARRGVTAAGVLCGAHCGPGNFGGAAMGRTSLEESLPWLPSIKMSGHRGAQPTEGVDRPLVSSGVRRPGLFE